MQNLFTKCKETKFGNPILKFCFLTLAMVCRKEGQVVLILEDHCKRLEVSADDLEVMLHELDRMGHIEIEQMVNHKEKGMRVTINMDCTRIDV